MIALSSRSLALALVLGACGPPAPSPTPPRGEPTQRPERDEEVSDAAEGVPGRAPTPAERRAIAQLMRVAEGVRDLRFSRAVPFRVQSREVITAFVREKIEVDELERARVFYVALGLLDPGLDVRELLIRVLGEQIVGYYDPDRGLMVVREDVAVQLRRSSRLDRELGEAEMVIVHELVHALQDQRLGLGASYEQERTIDGDNAFAALVEGDATLAMIGHMAARGGQPLARLTRNVGVLRMLVRGNPQTVQGREIESAPPIVRIPLVSRYLDGMVFCATLHGANGWVGVDAAHRRPPTTTEQILHPARYAAGDEPVEITLPELAALGEAGLVLHEEDSLGELEMSIYFGLAQAGSERDESAAEGWGGDRLRVYRDAAGRTSVVWFTTWDDEGEAREAESAARAVAALETGENRSTHRVERIGRSVLIVRDLPAVLHPPVLSAFAELAPR